ncbi:hypothetical protein [Silvanigrella aquatica]|uniref:Alginate export domain-containing protein n=1 Tax=Silvanigrella aquatica TaxID=1915309 RepID=A0A1L4D375_9BACT|nr:hypothetical protein [Silvanigrella aquatica]APJ04649.1 hypothetical protein AXG55_12340 [Silvanigrella aquatica]
MFFINRCIEESLFRKSRGFYCIIAGTMAFFSVHPAFSEETAYITDNYKLTYGSVIRGSLKTASDYFSINSIPNQNLENQASSAAAYSVDFLSARLGLEIKDIGSLKTRVDYFWQNPIQYNLYPKDYSQKELLFRDLYIEIPFQNKGFSIWLGRRTFEFDEIYLFQKENPFNQIELQGFGYSSDVFQASFSVNKETVFTTGTDQNNVTILDSLGKPKLFQNDDYIFTAFLSGKFLLSEGKIFQPILTLRAYESRSTSNPQGVQKNTVTTSSSFIAGGIFSRPISDGLKGTTTIWFESLPADKTATPDNNTQNGSYYGEGRIPPNYPQNTIGFADSSEYYINRRGGLLTGIVLLNNTYASSLPVLMISSDRKSLIPDSNSSSRTINRVSIAIQPVFYFTNYLQLGLDTNYNYVSKKLIANDANSFVITPILKYAFDKQLKTTKYIYTSISYGHYDWKVKTFSDGSKTDQLLTTQTGIYFNF